jgi:streptogramin lyase
VLTRTSVAGGADDLLRYDLDGRRRLQRVPIAPGAAAIAAGAGSVWVATTREHRVIRVRPGAARPRAWTSLSEAATALAYGEGRVWASIPSADALAQIDVRTRREFEFRAAERPARLVVTAGHLFVASFIANTLVKVDPRTLRPDPHQVPVGRNPFAVAAGGGDVWVTGLADGTLTRVAAR